MELDDYRNIINQKQASSDLQFSLDALEKIRSDQPKNPVQKIRKKLFVEWGVSLVLILVFIYLNLTIPGFLHPLAFAAMMILTCAYVLFGVYSVIKLAGRKAYTENLEVFLTNFTIQLKTYIKWLERSILVTLPISFTIGYCSGIYFAGSSEFLEVLLSLRSILSFTAVGLLITVLGYYLNRWTYRKIYGANIRELEEILTDFSEIDDH